MDLEQRLATLAAAVRASPHNLVSRADLARLEERHLGDSVALAQRLPHRAPIADVGSGGGFPGLVVAAHRPKTPVTLIEATRKKAEFLRATAMAMDLPAVEVVWGRVETLGAGPLRGRFAVVTARAVAPLARLVPWCAPLLTDDGELHLVKGARWEEELRAALPVIRASGLVVIRLPAASSAVPGVAVDGRTPAVVTIGSPRAPRSPA